MRSLVPVATLAATAGLLALGAGCAKTDGRADGATGASGLESGVSGLDDGNGSSGASASATGNEDDDGEVGGSPSPGDSEGDPSVSETTSPEGGDGPTFDLGSGGSASAGEAGGAQGCKGVDFLFVIDNSGSMEGEQQNLINSFPGFIDSIQTKLTELGATAFHIMVTDTDAATIEFNPGCLFECYANPTGMCSDGTPCALSGDIDCLQTCASDINATCASGLVCKDHVECGSTDECACTLGAGKREDAMGAPCPIESPARFLEQGEVDLPGTFDCLARVGTNGSGAELQVQSAVQAISSELGAPGACNERFVRRDAALVITIITDEEDGEMGGSAGTPEEWKTKILEAKGGDERGVVMLGLVGDTGEPGAVCSGGGLMGSNGADPSPILRGFVSSFMYNVLGSVCSSDYAPFFEQAVDLIQTTCEDYVPPE